MTAVPDAWTPPEQHERPRQGLGPGFALLLVVVGVLLLLLGWAAVWVVLDVVRSFTENL